ncbi:MAG: Lrp/AsnC family transcriptional regulator [Desulfobacter sp.]|nr:Lrp/AsnC family transcriptional regulator [Desulfobacter sp.]WDP87049.1 MAG: Lrp/AsnC family transcriptional regulator [Desulfobacter sp.]
MEKDPSLDALDRKLIRLLTVDGRIPVKKLVDTLGITNPTLNSRMKNLIRSGLLKISGLIDPFRTKNLIMALVAIQINDDTKLGRALDEIAELDEVHCAYSVTGRFDIFAEVVFSEGMESLYRFVSEKLPALGYIADSESFVVMKAKNKWIMLPENLKNWSL